MALENAWTSHLGGISLCQLKLPKSAPIQCALYQTTTLILILNKFDHLFAASVADVPYSRVLQEHKNVARHRKLLLSSKSPVPPASNSAWIGLDSAAPFQKSDYQFPYSYPHSSHMVRHLRHSTSSKRVDRCTIAGATWWVDRNWPEIPSLDWWLVIGYPWIFIPTAEKRRFLEMFPSIPGTMGLNVEWFHANKTTAHIRIPCKCKLCKPQPNGFEGPLPSFITR